MDYREDQLIEVNVVFLYATLESIKIEDCDGKQIWIPISTLGCEPDEVLDWEDGVEMTLSIRDSMAREKGLI